LCVAGAVPIPGLPRATWRGIRKCDVQRGAGISRIGGQNLWVVIIDGVSAVEPDSVIVRNGNPHRSVGSASRHERVTASVRETQTRVGITIAGSAGILLFSLLAAICRALASPREPDCDPGRYRVGCREHAMEDLVNRDTDAVLETWAVFAAWADAGGALAATTHPATKAIAVTRARHRPRSFFIIKVSTA